MISRTQTVLASLAAFGLIAVSPAGAAAVDAVATRSAQALPIAMLQGSAASVPADASCVGGTQVDSASNVIVDAQGAPISCATDSTADSGGGFPPEALLGVAGVAGLTAILVVADEDNNDSEG